MNREIMIYENEEFGQVRTMMIDGEAWFVGRDVAEILGYTDTNKAVAMQGYCLDKLVNDEDEYVREMALRVQKALQGRY